jgi:hypothetical protein
LKTKFSNDDNRFKIDDRFVESDEEKQVKKSKQKIDKIEENSSNSEGDDQENDVIKKSTTENIKSEHLSSLKILEEITGKQLIKPKSEEEEKKSKKSSLTKNKIVRYDPSKEDHKMYELNNEKSSSSDDCDSASSSNEDDTTAKESIATTTNKKVEEDSNKFFQIEPNLKDLFSSSDVFKFKFSNEIEENRQNLNETLEITDLATIKSGQKINFMDSISFSGNSKHQSKREKYFNSSESELEDEEDQADEEDEEEYEQEEEMDMSENENDRPKYTKIESKPASNNKKKPTNNQTQNRVISFLPDFDKDQVIREALDYFHNKQTSEEIHDDWQKLREGLVKEYKKKHKGVLRRQRVKENENLLPWKKNQTSSNFKSGQNNYSNKKQK